MSTFPVCEDVLDRSVELYQIPDISKALRVPITRVHQMLRDRLLLAVRRDSVVGVPAIFLEFDFEPGRNRILRWVPGLLAVLHDGGYSGEETLTWLFTEDDSLPGTPAEALRGHLAREVIRRAQALAF
ncbi:Rv2175c family DNA-binding protein [Tomitella biformata]|uniref:Rv2175c family DNA-binding protein n=1 Tax=Tomitella biformata TaxID=630403 RepID=UPI000464CAC0|nr:Rv2175c family DNA-binding protein [Tomitella biformata]